MIPLIKKPEGRDTRLNRPPTKDELKDMLKNGEHPVWANGATYPPVEYKEHAPDLSELFFAIGVFCAIFLMTFLCLSVVGVVL